MITPQSLVDGNLAYREPALYDELLADATVTDGILDAVRATGTTVTSVLDLGCGTGRVLADLSARRGWRAIGVDLQPGLIDHARATRPGLELYPDDIRTVRLDTTADLIVCVGNTLSYLHTESELAAAFTTMAVHARAGALLLIATLATPGVDRSSRTRVESAVLGEADVDLTTRWDPVNGLLTTARSWSFRNGRTERDHMVRRVWERAILAEHAVRAGFRPTVGCRSADLALAAVLDG